MGEREGRIGMRASVPGVGMWEDLSNPDRELPNKPAGLRGVREWFFGQCAYAHPALRWTANPLLLLAWLCCSLTTLAESRNSWLLALSSVLVVVSLTARATSFLILRKRRRANQRQLFEQL
jgi:hypothetical protein